MAKRLTATQRLRSNVRRQIRRMEERGYRIPTEIKERLSDAKYQTLKSFQRNKYAKLYGESTALLESGSIVSGTEYRKEERSASAKKAAETRKQYREPSTIYEESESTWERERRLQDEADRLNAQYYQEGEIAYDEITSMIEQYPSKGANSLSRALAREIEKYGRDNVLMSIGMSPETVIEHVRTILFYEDGADAIHGAFIDFFNLITGTIPTDSEAKDLGNTLDQMTDFESR